YAKMTDWYWFRSQGFLQPMYHLPGDDITENNGVFSTWEIFNNINPTEGRLSYFWNSTYEMIQRTNVVIEKTQAADPSEFDNPEFLDLHRGEALFLRALAFFKLFN